jgi:hypothetical protein
VVVVIGDLGVESAKEGLFQSGPTHAHDGAAWRRRGGGWGLHPSPIEKTVKYKHSEPWPTSEQENF